MALIWQTYVVAFMSVNVSFSANAHRRNVSNVTFIFLRVLFFLFNYVDFIFDTAVAGCVIYFVLHLWSLMNDSVGPS